MTKLIEPETSRLLLRQWRREDREPFAAMCADPRVMRFFPAPLSRDGSDAMADRCEALIAERGWGFWAVELKADRTFIGFVGLHTPSPDLPCSPCVEIGWRLAASHWRKGLASEAATAALHTGFQLPGLDEIVSFAARGNERSIAVMLSLGMQPAGHFEHPHVPAESGLRDFCLYRISRTAFMGQAKLAQLPPNQL